LSCGSASDSMPRSRPTNSILAALSVGMVLAWGLNFLFVRVGLGSSPPLWLAALRAVLGTVGIVAGLLAWRPDVAMTPRERIDALLIGIPNTGLFFGLWFSAASQVPPGQTAVVIYTFPLWVVVLSFLLLSERPRVLVWPSVLVGFLGVVLIEQPWSGAGGHVPPVAVVELLAAAACWALGTVLLKWRIRGPALRTASAYQLLSGAVVLLLGAVLFEPHPAITVSTSFVLSLLWLGLVGTAFAYAAWFALLERFPATTISTWAFLTPVVALVASAVIFGERLDAVQLLGVAAVLGSVVAVARTAATELASKGST